MRNTPLALALLLTLFCTCVRAQTIVDDFSDGDLLNPDWTGDTQDFVVENGRLRLMATGAGTSTLELRMPEASNGIDSFSLEFLVEMDFNPSSSNFCRLNLSEIERSGPSLEQSLLTELGGRASSSDQSDSWIGSLFGGNVEIGSFAGQTGALDQSPALARVRMEYVREEGWVFMADYTGGTNFEEQGRIETSATLHSQIFQIVCTYTTTRADKFYFDDLVVRSVPLVDTEAPQLLRADIVGPRMVELGFSEAVDDVLLSALTNYSFDNPNVTLASVTVSGLSVLLNFANDLPNGEEVTVTVAETRDLSGNMATDLTASFRYNLITAPRTDNVLINEFFPDPSPMIGLPEEEFVELYNPTDTTVDASQISIASGGSDVALGAGVRIPANGYLIITKPEAVQAYLDEGLNVVGISLPALSNAGDEITILNQGQILQQITYTDDWYNDADRDGGGYSIEYVGGGADAGCSGNWRASLDRTGGTPGRPNSVTGQPADTLAPVITLADISESGVQLSLSEATTIPLTADLFAFSPTLDFTLSQTEDGVFLAADLVEGVVYTLTVFADYSDCAGNFPANDLAFNVGLLSNPEVGDVIINEILFNPATGGDRFVELFNASDKIFQIEGWVLSNDQVTNSSRERTISEPRLFLPGDYLVLTPEPDDILARFLEVDPSLLVDQTLPGLGNDDGNITVTANGVVLDAFDYTEEYHSELLSPNDGVSLERLRQNSPTQDGSNWFSAASTENFGTPTRPNSQARDGVVTGGSNVFSLVSETFSPDADGFEDILEIQYALPQTGFLTKVTIFDAQGRQIRRLAKTELLGTEGTLRWDGENDEGQKARTGLYVLLVELFNPNGDVSKEKLVAVLAGER